MNAWVEPSFHIRENVRPEPTGPMYKVGEVPLGAIAEAILELAGSEWWDRYSMRTRMFENSPHRDVHDIWLRYRDFAEFDPENPQAFAGPHISTWYAAYHQMPWVRTVIGYVLARCIPVASEIGGVLITKIPPGKSVLRHSDAGHWHSTYYRDKFMCHLQSAPGQYFSYDERSYGARTGDVVKFDNLIPHSVTNDSDVDRISLILATRAPD
jgi:hypothetical protein